MFRIRKNGLGAGGAIDQSIPAPGGSEYSRLARLSLKLSDVGAAETVTLTLDNGEGANYDFEIASASMDGETEYLWTDASATIHVRAKSELYAGDAILVEHANGNSRDWYLEAEFVPV